MTITIVAAAAAINKIMTFHRIILKRVSKTKEIVIKKYVVKREQ